jgi:hypothetical protein
MPGRPRGAGLSCGDRQTVETVEFVLFDRAGYDAFAAELRESEACHGRGD